jgi:cytochrome P450
MGGPLVLSGRPEDVRDIFRADPMIFEPWNTDVLKPVLGSNSVILTSGTKHREYRKLLVPPFHGQRMRSYAQSMASAAHDCASKWHEGEDFRAYNFTQSVSLEVILDTVFGVTDPVVRSGLKALLPELLNLGNGLPMFLKFLRLPVVPSWRRFTAVRKQTDELIGQLIRDRASSDDRGDDILSMLLEAEYDDGSRMDELEVRDQLLSILSAGHETTAIAMAWTLYWLHRHPEKLNRLLEDISEQAPTGDPEALTQIPYLDAVVNESLRIHPVLPDLARKLRKDTELMGCKLKAGTAVGAVAFLTHRDPEIYEDPDEWIPERFLDHKFSPFEFYPFGGGNRRCIGAAFASFEAKVVLGTLLSAYHFELLDNRPLSVERRHITLMPRGGVRMKHLGQR